MFFGWLARVRLFLLGHDHNKEDKHVGDLGTTASPNLMLLDWSLA